MRIVALTLCALVIACGASTESSETLPTDMMLGHDMVVTSDVALLIDAVISTMDAMVSSDLWLSSSRMTVETDRDSLSRVLVGRYTRQ